MLAESREAVTHAMLFTQLLNGASPVMQAKGVTAGGASQLFSLGVQVDCVQVTWTSQESRLSGCTIARVCNRHILLTAGTEIQMPEFTSGRVDYILSGVTGTRGRKILFDCYA